LLSGVGHEVKPLSNVWCSDARSAQIGRPNGVILIFQVSRNKIEPLEAVRAGNLFAKNDWRVPLFDKSKPIRPQMAFVGEAPPLACGTERLTGARSSPHGEAFGPARKSKGVRPSSDTCEEMGRVRNFAKVKIDNAAPFYSARGYVPGLD
jgi:hypothetical protein